MLQHKIRVGIRILNEEGILSFLKSVAHNLRLIKRPVTVELMVKDIDIVSVDWTEKHKYSPRSLTPKKHYSFAWVMSPPGKGSGGHLNLFRFIDFLEKAGHECHIYLYTNTDKRTLKEIFNDMGDSFPDLTAKTEWLEESTHLDSHDGVFATGWETTYPVYRFVNKAKRFYFIQDYEPYFFPVGSNHELAQNTYKMGFFGITAGAWLANKLSKEFKMSTDHYDFAADTSLYRHTNKKARKEIFFYARPVTPRRGFELGLLALNEFHKLHPEYVINLAGWDVSDYKIPFPCNNLKSLEVAELSDLYNRCAAGLVISLTNLSLLPAELLACGAIPVVNSGENNEMVIKNKFVHFAETNPRALARALSDVVTRKDLLDYSSNAAASVDSSGWEASGQKFVQIVERELMNG